jgi:hypothetical protein
MMTSFTVERGWINVYDVPRVLAMPGGVTDAV